MLVVKRVYHLLTLGNILIASFSGFITKLSGDQFFSSSRFLLRIARF